MHRAFQKRYALRLQLLSGLNRLFAFTASLFLVRPFLLNVINVLNVGNVLNDCGNEPFPHSFSTFPTFPTLITLRNHSKTVRIVVNQFCE